MPGPQLIANGVDGTTGAYLSHPVEAETLVRHLRQRDLPAPRETSRGFEGDAGDLAQAGWGVVFGPSCDDGVRRALAPLLRLREAQASSEDDRRYRMARWQPGESSRAFLDRHEVSFGPIDPTELPYFLLLVGGPEEIPYDVQLQLDLSYAVGRLALETTEAYARYAEAVVAAEKGHLRRPRRLVVFASSNPHDHATALSAEHLAAPIAGALAASRPSWEVEGLLARSATKERLGQLLEEGSPGLLFTASHGIGFPAGSPEQAQAQGALLCQDWPGPRRWRGPLLPEHYFSAADLSERAQVAGLIAFFFACFGAGTPSFDQFAAAVGSPLGQVQAQRLASRPMVSRLPQRLLGHPRGSALAMVGHLDRAWSSTYRSGQRVRTGLYRSLLLRLAEGLPLGEAMKFFGTFAAEQASELTDLLAQAKVGAEVDGAAVASHWTAHHDARAYVVLGDPAVRVATGEA